MVEQQGAVEWLDEARVDHACRHAFLGLQAGGHGERVRHPVAQRPDHDLRAFAQHLGLTDGQ